LIKIPVLGSGDLFSPLDIHKYLSYTGASGVIVARGAIHNPGIFRLNKQMLDRDTPLIQSSSDQLNHGSEDNDWKDNTVEPQLDEEQKL
jgi:tRNA-dihydrouridine synthase